MAWPYRCRTSNDRGVPVLPALPSGGAEHVSIGSEEIGHWGPEQGGRYAVACNGSRCSGIYATEVTKHAANLRFRRTVYG